MGRLVPYAGSLLILLAGVFSLSTTALGHALQPGYLELRKIDQVLYAALWKVPDLSGRPMAIAVKLPENCDPRTAGQSTWDGVAHVTRFTATCPGGLEGGIISIEGLERTTTDVLVRFDFSDGRSQAHRLTATETSFKIPDQPSRLEPKIRS